MPELPEVEITARRLNTALAGAEVESALAPGMNVMKTFDPPLEALARMSEDEFRETFRGSPVKRAKYRGLLRNVAVAMGNSGLAKFRPALEKLAQHPDPVVQEHAVWALRRLGKAESE